MNYELLYLLRRYAEDNIELSDELIKYAPTDDRMIEYRQRWARIAMHLHARIERLEHNYDN